MLNKKEEFPPQPEPQANAASAGEIAEYRTHIQRAVGCHAAPPRFAEEPNMSADHERTRCPQCGDDHAEFDADCSGSYRMTSLICGYYEREDLEFDADGICCGSRRVIGKGFGVLRYRRHADNFLTNYFLKSAKVVLDAERWVRRMLRRRAVDAETAYVTRWSDDLNRVEVLVGDPRISSQT